MTDTDTNTAYDPSSDFYILPVLSPEQKTQRLKELTDKKLKAYEKSLHPVLLEKYRKYNYVFTNWVPTAEQENVKKFWETVELTGNPITREIHSIYRIRILNKEYIWYGEELKTTSKNGTRVHCYHTVGKFENPEFIPTINNDTGEVNGTEIESIQTTYELLWPADFTDEMEQNLIPNVSLVVVAGNRKYGGFDCDDFKNRTFDELVMLGKYGTVSPVMLKEIEKIQSKNKVK